MSLLHQHLFVTSIIVFLCSDVFKVRPTLHAGMVQKPLEPYHPLAHRSRLPSPSVVMPYKNSSQIVLGDRSSHYKRLYVTSNANVHSQPKMEMCSNPGIVAQTTTRIHHNQAQ